MKYTVKEKQEQLKKLKDSSFFDADKELFQKRFPRNNLHRELARVNSVNKERLCSQMLYALLDVCSAEDILRNRGVEVEQPQSENAVFESVEQVKEVLSEIGIAIETMYPAYLETLIGRNIAEIKAEAIAEKEKSVLVELAKKKLAEVGVDFSEFSDEILEKFAKMPTENFEENVAGLKAALHPADAENKNIEKTGEGTGEENTETEEGKENDKTEITENSVVEVLNSPSEETDEEETEKTSEKKSDKKPKNSQT